MRFDILTLFPEVFPAYLKTSIIGRAQQTGTIQTRLWNIRDYATDKHKTVDDTPYGGGAGMVMKIEPIDRALQAIHGDLQLTTHDVHKTVVLSARGKQFTQPQAEEYSSLDALTLICGRYEGIDQRVADYLADEELSIGPYVLAGGELAALVVIETISRLIPGVLGSEESLQEESHWKLPPPLAGSRFQAGEIGNWKLFPEYPQYTKPEEYRGWKVPEILLSGDHEAVKTWREQQRKMSNDEAQMSKE